LDRKNIILSLSALISALGTVACSDELSREKAAEILRAADRKPYVEAIRFRGVWQTFDSEEERDRWLSQVNSYLNYNGIININGYNDYKDKLKSILEWKELGVVEKYSLFTGKTGSAGGAKVRPALLSNPVLSIEGRRFCRIIGSHIQNQEMIKCELPIYIWNFEKITGIREAGERKVVEYTMTRELTPYAAKSIMWRGSPETMTESANFIRYDDGWPLASF
jgi:hypothetical protein